jgi:hypothetical protein
VRPGSARRDQLVADRARQRDVGEGAALAGVVKVAELATSELECRSAEARLGDHLHIGPVADLSHQCVDGHTSVQFRDLECVNAHGANDATSSALEVKPDV